ncbi:type II toxin-antitoxin system HicA family toxin [Morganella morganii]
MKKTRKSFSVSKLAGYQKKAMEGSRGRFIHSDRNMILLHRLHPDNQIKGGALKAV